MWRAWILAAALVAPWAVDAAEPSGTITILEGDALVYRAAGRVHAAEGLRLLPGDIVETGASTFAQVELADHSRAREGRRLLSPQGRLARRGERRPHGGLPRRDAAALPRFAAAARRALPRSAGAAARRHRLRLCRRRGVAQGRAVGAALAD